MNWNKKLTEIESSFGYHKSINWQPIIDYVRDLINEYSGNVDVNIRVIYLLHNILVEEIYSETEYEILTNLLIKNFNESYKKFSGNAEYLFFIGEILYISEWYFGLDDDMKPMEQRLAFKMQKEAFEKEPNNQLYKWGYLNSKGEKEKSFLLSKEILSGKGKYLDWLKSKGFPGMYIIENLEYCYKNYK